MTALECIDCRAERELAGKPAPRYPRKVVGGGVRSPRCATHARQRKNLSKAGAHERRVQKVYGLRPGDYGKMYLFQGKRCALCRRATGATKALAVDHDHQTGLAYGLLCGPCNRDVLGPSHRDIAYFERCIEYLRNPPARQLGIVAYHEDTRKDDGGNLA